MLLPHPVGPTRATFMPGSTFSRMSQTTGSPRQVAEADAVELDGPGRRPARAGSAWTSAGRGSTDIGLEVKDLAQPVDARGRLLEDIGQVGQPGHGAEDHPRQGRRRDDPAGRHPAPQHLVAPPPRTPAPCPRRRSHAEVRERRAQAGSPCTRGTWASSSCTANSAISSGSRARP